MSEKGRAADGSQPEHNFVLRCDFDAFDRNPNAELGSALESEGTLRSVQKIGSEDLWSTFVYFRPTLPQFSNLNDLDRRVYATHQATRDVYFRKLGEDIRLSRSNQPI